MYINNRQSFKLGNTNKAKAIAALTELLKELEASPADAAFDVYVDWAFYKKEKNDV